MPSRSRRPHFQSTVHPDDTIQPSEGEWSQPRAPHEAVRNVRLDMDNDPHAPAVHHRPVSKDLMQELPSRNRPVDPIYDKQRHNSLKRRASRSSSYNTVRRLRNVPPSAFSEMGTDGVANLLEMDAQAQEVEEPEAHQREALRDLNMHLTKKREVRIKLAQHPKSKQVGCWQYSKYTWSMKWQHFKTSVKDLRFILQLWHRGIREIEGNLGSGVASYFYFLRWLLGLNILTSAIICCFVVMPQALSHLPSAKCEGIMLSFSGNCSTSESVSALKFTDFLTGGGWLENKLLYYGAYISAVFKAWGQTWYNLPLAYLLGFGMTMILTMVFIAYSLAKSHKKYYIEQSGLTGNYFFNKVFCGWDFAITSEKAALLQSKGLQLDLKEQLASLMKKNKEESLSNKFLTISRYVLFNLLSLASLGGIGFLILHLLKNKIIDESGLGNSEMFLSLIITAITVVMPAVFSQMVKYEGYKSHRTQLRVAMFRSMLLILVVIGCPLYFWTVYEDELKEGFSTTPLSTITVPDVIVTTIGNATTFSIPKDVGIKKERCWETEIGKELYRFVIVDFFVCVLVYFPICWLRSVLYKHGVHFLGNLEFDVIWNTWNLLYNQAICWIGSFFSPLLPVIIIIKFIITFYSRKLSVLNHFQPPTRIWRAHRNRTDFKIVTFSIVVLSMLGIGYIIVKQEPSKICGPFQGQETSYQIVFWVMESIDETEWVATTAAYIMKPGCVTLLILTLCCVAYYARAVAKARFKMVQLLQDQVKLEGKDKVFLLRMYESALNSWHNRSDDGRGDVQFGSYTRMPTEDHNGQPRRWSDVDLNRNVPRAEVGSKDSPGNQDPHSSASQLNYRSVEELQRGKEYGVGMTDGEGAPSSRNSYTPQERFQMDDSVRRSPHSPVFHRSTENIQSPSRNFSPFGAGAINPVFREDSPYKSRTPPSSRKFRDPIQPFPGITHQPPFQNLGMNRRLSKGASAEDVRSDSKRRPR